MNRWFILAALGVSTSAPAQPGGTTSADAHTADADKAAALYDEGKRHFDLGEYSAAIASWRRSYLLSSEPLLLFNIGQAYRLSGNCAQANRFYRNYRRAVPEPQNRAELEQAMAVCAGVEPATRDAETKPPEPAETKPTETPAPRLTESVPPTPSSVDGGVAGKNVDSPSVPPDHGRSLRITGLLVAGGGAAAGVVALVSGIQASREATAVSEQPQGSIWTGALQDHQSAGKSAQTRARVFGVVGGIAMVGGGILWWLGHRAGTTRVDIAVHPNRTEVSLSCAF